MDRKWLPLNALRAFEAAGNLLSFTAAANKLTVAQSAVSRHVIVLEQFLGVPLFERRPQQLVLTEAGKHLLPVVTKSFDRIDQALGEIIREKGTPKRVLKVFLPPTFAHQLAIPLLQDFRAEQPDITLEIASKPATNPNDGDADVAVVYKQPEVSTSILDLLWMVQLSVVCTANVAQRIVGADLAAIVASNDLLHVKLEGRPRHEFWEMFMRRAGHPEIKVNRGLVFDTAQLAVQYALSGEGLALVDPMLFKAEIASGKLVQPFDLLLDDGYGYYLATHPEDLNNEAVALFRSWLIRRFGGHKLSES